MEKMDDNTKNILYPKGSIFRILKDDIISAEFKIVKGAIAEAVSDIEVNDKYAEVCCNGETFVIETDIMDIILTKDPIENKSVKMTSLMINYDGICFQWKRLRTL